MNSLYKKISLVCLVSLTANQAAQAFQISDVLGWFKNNQKSVACVTVLAAMTAVLCYFKYTKVAAAANEVQNYGPFEDMIKKLRAKQSSKPAKAKVQALEKVIQKVLNQDPGLHNHDCRCYPYYTEGDEEFVGYCFYIRSKKDNFGTIKINIDGESRVKHIDDALSTIVLNCSDDITLDKASNSVENNELLKNSLVEFDERIELMKEFNPVIYSREHVRARQIRIRQNALLVRQADPASDDEE